MIKNRLKLNKRPIYELPDNVIVGEFLRTAKTPKFTPDICLTSYGRLKIKKPTETVKQIWVKTSDSKLIEFISNYDWENKLRKTLVCQSYSNKFNLTVSLFKKILLEEYYGVRDDRK